MTQQKCTKWLKNEARTSPGRDPIVSAGNLPVVGKEAAAGKRCQQPKKENVMTECVPKGKPERRLQGMISMAGWRAKVMQQRIEKEAQAGAGRGPKCK